VPRERIGKHDLPAQLRLNQRIEPAVEIQDRGLSADQPVQIGRAAVEQGQQNRDGHQRIYPVGRFAVFRQAAQDG